MNCVDFYDKKYPSYLLLARCSWPEGYIRLPELKPGFTIS
jgi:hypothetical protein